jgi:hypothetical protein
MTVHPHLKSALLSLDDRLQPVLPLKAPVYTKDENVLDGAGIYTAEDWSRTRKRGAAQFGIDGHQYDSDAQYLRYIETAEPAKIASVASLMEAFDFGRFGRVFELGCGDMIQALHVTKRFPDLTYVATDFDPYLIERLAALPALARVEKRVFDVLKDPHDAFAGADLLLSWGLDAALDDAQLTALLRSARRFGIPYLMCSPTTIGPLTRAHQWSSARARERLLAERRIRMHGWARSVAYFKKVARAAGVSVRGAGRHGLYICLIFNE